MKLAVAIGIGMFNSVSAQQLVALCIKTKRRMAWHVSSRRCRVSEKRSAGTANSLEKRITGGISAS